METTIAKWKTTMKKMNAWLPLEKPDDELLRDTDSGVEMYHLHEYVQMT